MLSLPAPPQLVVANAMTARPNDVDGLLAELKHSLRDSLKTMPRLWNRTHANPCTLEVRLGEKRILRGWREWAEARLSGPEEASHDEL